MEIDSISNRGRWVPGFSRTIDGEIVSDEAIKTILFDLAEEYPRYGYKKLTVLLKSLFSIKINKKKVYRLCKEMDLLLPVERHYGSEQSLIAFKKVAVNEPNNHWQMDITYVTLFQKIIFVLGIIDTYTLEIVGYKAGFS